MTYTIIATHLGYHNVFSVSIPLKTAVAGMAEAPMDWVNRWSKLTQQHATFPVGFAIKFVGKLARKVTKGTLDYGS